MCRTLVSSGLVIKNVKRIANYSMFFLFFVWKTMVVSNYLKKQCNHFPHGKLIVKSLFITTAAVRGENPNRKLFSGCKIYLFSHFHDWHFSNHKLHVERKPIY